MLMVDLPLFASTSNAVPEGARLILVGDAESAAVGRSGQCLRDVIDREWCRRFVCARSSARRRAPES